MLIRNGRVYNTDKRSFENKDILVRDGMTAALGSFDDVQDEYHDILDAQGAYIIPGLVDIHTHGRAGHDFLSCTPQMLDDVARAYAAHGVTAVMPTLASAPFENMCASADMINRFIPADNAATLCGVHLEGRYLNPARKGAHKSDLIAPLDPHELERDEFRNCRALHITAAYELDSDGAFALKARELGATLGLGHTSATYAEAKLAESRGVCSYTHLFNAMPPLHHRGGGAVCAALEGNAFVELICDGIHVSEEMVRLVYRLKGNTETVLVSDSMEATDCPDGHYSIAGNPVIVKNGIALTEDGALAGSTVSLFTALLNLMRFCKIGFEEALPCATINPCREVGVDDRFGSIDVGKSADYLFVIDIHDPVITKTVIRGKICFE